MFERLKKNQFLFEELVKRDFKQKYKGTVLGMAWSVLAPLLNLLVMRLVFTQFFGRDMEHYTTYLFCGTLVWSYYRESTRGGMNALVSNANVFTKIKLPKYLFLLSKNVSALINFCLTLLVFFFFCILDHVTFTLKFLCLLYPIICLVVMNIGIGLILSALYVFFRDTSYLYDIFLTLLNYLSAIFYQVDRYPAHIRRLFLMNPVYCNIKYFRIVVIDGSVPSLNYHLLCAGYAILLLLIGAWMYKKFNHKFLYYV